MSNERVRTELEIALIGSRKLTEARKATDALGVSIENAAKLIKFLTKDNEALVRSVGNLNSLLSDAKRNFENAALGTKQATFSAEKYLEAVRETNAALAEQKAAVISLQNSRKSDAAFLAQGARAGRSNANAEANLLFD